MMVRFVCRSCGQKFKANEEYAGQASQCPACGVMVQIPVAPATHSSPIPVEPEVKQDILKFKPVFKKNEPASEQNPPPPEVAPAPEMQQDILKFKPEFKKSEPVPEQNIPQPEAAPEAPKLKMRLRTSPDAAPPPSSDPPAVIEPESSQLKMPGNVPPSSGIKMPPPLKTPAGIVRPPAAAPKQAFPVGFVPVTPKLPPGLTLIEDDES